MNNFLYLDKFLNKLGEIYSVLDLNSPFNNFSPAKLLTDEKLSSLNKPIYLKSSFETDLKHEEAIFLHSNGFYIYLSRITDTSDFEIKIIYKTEKYEQVKMFLNNLKKMK